MFSDFHLSFLLMCGFLLSVALSGVLRGRAVFEFPTIVALLGLAWVVPQGLELERNPHNTYGSESFWLYVMMCFGMVLLGFKVAKDARSRRIRGTAGTPSRVFDTHRLLIAAATLGLLGLGAALLMGEVDTSKMGGQWTGVITLYALFSKASGFALCLAALIYARTKSRIALLIAVVSSVPILTSAIYGVRREQIFDIVVLSLGAWYIAKGRSPSPVWIVAALLIGTVVLNSAANLRTYVDSGRGSLVGALFTAETYIEFDYTNLGQGKSSEVGLAQYDHWYMDMYPEWELGSEYWNAMVHQYVPAFLVGRDYKDGLRINTLSSRLQSGDVRGRFSLGSTRTGFSDSYRAFSYLGMVVFALVGCLFGYLFANVSAGSLSSQYFYLILLAEGLKAITHSTSEFFSALPFAVAISLLAFRFSARSIDRKRTSRTTAPIRAPTGL